MQIFFWPFRTGWRILIFMLNAGKIEQWIMQTENNCRLCFRACQAPRAWRAGFCRADTLRAARAALHFFEEPCISGQNGSGTVFFTFCPLQCAFCQNAAISREGCGKAITPADLARIFINLQNQKAENINLVTPGHFAPWVAKGLLLCKKELKIPVVYNTGSTETPETLRMLEGLVDIYLPDIKFYGASLAQRYAQAPGYFTNAMAALREMARQQPKNRYKKGMLQKGIIIRHLMLPGSLFDTMHVLTALLPYRRYPLSLMSQYTPGFSALPCLEKRLDPRHYERAVEKALDMGFTVNVQEQSSAGKEYIPAFDNSGLE